MKQLINVLSKKILDQITFNQSNIVRLEGFDNPKIYRGVCESLKSNSLINVFIAKITREKYEMFQNENKSSWEQDLIYLHQGNNSVYSPKQEGYNYDENSYVDFSNAITKWRNESANISNGKTTLILLMGTESAQDAGGLADTSVVISPKEILADLSKDYSQWFDEIIKNNHLDESNRKAIDTIYKALFSEISTDIFKLSDFIDSLDEYSFASIQEIINYICETLSSVWEVPSICDVTAVPKVSALNKGAIKSARIIIDAAHFIERYDDIPTTSTLKKLHKKFELYAEKNEIEPSAPFPDNQIFTSYSEFEKAVLDFMCGIDLEQNRGKLLSVDYSIINTIMGTKIKREPKEKTPTYSGTPMGFYSRIFLDAIASFSETFNMIPSKLIIKVDRISLSDCTEDQKDTSYQNICNFVGGILNFYNELAVEVEGGFLIFEYDETDSADPFDFENYTMVKDRIKSSGKWGDPCKIYFHLTASNKESLHQYQYVWSFSPYSPWLNAFSFLTETLYSKGDSLQLPTLVCCDSLQDYINCESEDEFFAQFQKFDGTVVYNEHKDAIKKCFDEETYSWFELVCEKFRDFAVKLTEHGFFNAVDELRDLVQEYTKMLSALQDKFSNFTDIQKSNLPLLVNSFMIISGHEIFQGGDIPQVIVPAYNPMMLEKIDAQQLFLRNGFEELLKSKISGVSLSSVNAKLDTLNQLSSITQAADIVYRKTNKYFTCMNMWEYFGVYYDMDNTNGYLQNNAEGLSIIVDDDAQTTTLSRTPMSNIIIRNVLDYIHTFPSREDGLNIAFIAPTDIQHIVSAIHYVAKMLDTGDFPVTINANLICIDNKKNYSTYLRKCLDCYFNESTSVKVNTYLHYVNIKNKGDEEVISDILRNYDICFCYDILQFTDIQFEQTNEQPVDINYEKFPMTFVPDVISQSHSKFRRVNLSQFQFRAVKQHTQISHRIGNPDTIQGIYRAYKRLELEEAQEAIINIAHNCCKWVVCIDEAIDRDLLSSSSSKIIGFSTGEGNYGELNVTVSARSDILNDIKLMLSRKLSQKFNWGTKRLTEAANYCIDELCQYMDGSRILKALNPYDYEINNFLAYILTVQMLGLNKTSDGYIVRALISLDSYRHWFYENENQNGDNKRPDFMLIEIPYTSENISSTGGLEINVKIIECKMAYQNEAHTTKAKEQLEKGIRTMSANWDPQATGIMHRYWLNQLYRAIIFQPLNMDSNIAEYSIVRDKIYGILDGRFKINWTGDVFAFWLDINDDSCETYEISSDSMEDLKEAGISIGTLTCHNCGQLFVQKMLLPEGQRTEHFEYYDTREETPSDSFDYANEEEPDSSTLPSQSTGDVTIPAQMDVYEPFLKFIIEKGDCTKQEAQKWFDDYYNFSQIKSSLMYQNKEHTKEETPLDFVITEFLKEGLLENHSERAFHVTELGKRVYSYLLENGHLNNFWETVLQIKNANNDANNFASESEIREYMDNRSTNYPDQPTSKNTNNTTLSSIRVLIGKDKRGNKIYWEFGHEKLANRHVLITGTSGQGKTYAIQTMIYELSRQNISSVVFDYTDGFLPGKLEPEFEEKLGGKIRQEIAYTNRIPVNPFRVQSIEIPTIGGVPENSTAVAGRISDILKHVYSFGDQQSACIYSACKQGIDQYGENMNFGKLRLLLENLGTPQSKSVLSKMAQFFDMDLFDTSKEFDWKQITQGGGNVTVIQLTGLDRELQTVITEIMMWDAWYSLTKFGDKNTPFVVVFDEAQNLSFKEKSPAEKILREGRKYGWSAWFATQFLRGALDSGEISNLQQAAFRLYFKPTGEEMNYTADQIADTKADSAEWLNTLKGIQKGQCIVQGDRIKTNGQFGAAKPVLVDVCSFSERIREE